MKDAWRFSSIATVILIVSCSDAFGQFDTADPDHGKYGLHFQAGAAKSITRTSGDLDAAEYLVTGDLVGLVRTGPRSTFGLGLRVTVDDHDKRLGLKGLWRKPLRLTKDSYFQFASGVHLSASSNRETSSLPGYFFEAELGLSNWFALAATLEVLSYDRHQIAWDSVRGRGIFEEGGTTDGLYFGAKLGQWPGAGATATGLLVAVIVAYSALDDGIL